MKRPIARIPAAALRAIGAAARDRRAALLPALALALGTAATPAAARIEHDAAIWLNATVMGPIEGRLVFFGEVQPRISDHASRVSAVIVRPAIGWRVSKALTVYQGYAHIVEPRDGAPDRAEDRLFQQVTWNVGRIGRLEVQSRSRLEQRWRSDGDGMAIRARQMLRLEQPLARGDRRLAALGSVEAFVGLKSADWGGISGFDQLRTFIGLEIPLPGTSTIEAGYLNQWRDAAGARSDMAHVASIALFLRL